MIKLIGIGDNVVDRYEKQGIMYPGGNSLNFAVYGKMLGYDSAYVGVFGDDEEARLIINALTDLGVDISQCVRVHGETGVCIIQLSNCDRIITDVNDAGVVKKYPLKVTDELSEYIKRFDVAHSSCYSYIEDQLPKIKKTGVPLIYDFSDKWDETMFDKVCPHIDIAYFSGKNLSDENIKQILVRTIELGSSLGISTNGKRGVIIYNGNSFFSKIPYNLEGKFIDTLGAGDSFLTGFITNYYSGEKIFKILMENDPNKYITYADRKDYINFLIQHSMSVGNLFAIKTCSVSGAFGYGKSF